MLRLFENRYFNTEFEIIIKKYENKKAVKERCNWGCGSTFLMLSYLVLCAKPD